MRCDLVLVPVDSFKGGMKQGRPKRFPASTRALVLAVTFGASEAPTAQQVSKHLRYQVRWRR